MIHLDFDSNVPIFSQIAAARLREQHRDLFYRLLLERYSEGGVTYVIFTHLIGEVSQLIEEVVILKNGAVTRNESCETLHQNGFPVSGRRDFRKLRRKQIQTEKGTKPVGLFGILC